MLTSMWDKRKTKWYSCVKGSLAVSFPGGSAVKNLPAKAGDTGLTLVSGRSPGAGNGNLLHYSCLENPWTEEPGRLQSIGSHRVGHNWSDSASINVFAWKIPWTKEPGGLQSMGCKELDRMSDLNNKRTHMIQQLYLCVYLRELETYVHPKTCTQMFIAFLLTVAKT